MPAVNQVPKHIADFCKSLFFRQSLIKDYLSCPNMALYRWILQVEEERSWMASFFGTAGHEVVFQMHTEDCFNWSYIELMGRFERAFYKAVEESKNLPRISKAFDSIEEQLASCAPEYVSLLQGYQSDPRNNKFISTINEQLFVLEFGGVMYTGMIDQGGYYVDSTFSVRDLKFRQMDMRPSRVELDLDIQMTVYAAAVKYGNPACEVCRPRYEMQRDVPVAERTTVVKYAGPCAKCAALIGTPKWPRKFAERCEMIWMRDYGTRQKDEFAQKIKDPSGSKELSLAGRRRTRMITNPKWVEGYKKGDYLGPAIMSTHRKANVIEIFMSDVTRIAMQLQQGIFYRKPGEQCNFWCQYRQQCLKAVELDSREIDIGKAEEYGTLDPFGEG